jgi:glycosyltransferase involved in cell wall biosynthesis
VLVQVTESKQTEILNYNQSNKLPKVSIITVSYNSSKTIEDTIQSVINQSYPNIEYIIIDGGSTDGTVDIIKKYKNYISEWISESDTGIYDAMNKGLKSSNGELIHFLNSDDYYFNNNIVFKMVSIYNQTSTKQVVINGDIKKVYIRNKTEKVLQPYGYPVELKKSMVLHHPTFFVSANCYKEYGVFSTEYIISGDYDLSLRFYINNVNFVYCEEIITCMRDQGISDSNIFIAAIEDFKVRKKYRVPIFINIKSLILRVIFYYYGKVKRRFY